MTLVLNLPQELEDRLKRVAEARDVPVEEFAVDLLDNALEEEDSPTLEQVVAKIKALPPNPDSIHHPTGSLAEYLRNAPPEPTDFNVEEWDKQWAEIEAEMKRIDRGAVPNLSQENWMQR